MKIDRHEETLKVKTLNFSERSEDFEDDSLWLMFTFDRAGTCTYEKLQTKQSPEISN